jgi:hypothetical protein
MPGYNAHIHIVSFDIPFPANYGGVIDVYYKIKALTDAGIKVHLHAFEYGRDKLPHLEKLCHKVNYYKRHLNKSALLSRVPYIAATRNDPRLLVNLLKDDYPILFEGLHTCFFLEHPDIAHRVRIVRMHNIEHQYYRSLAQAESRVFKKYFFAVEARKLRRFEKILSSATAIAAISPSDTRYLSRYFSNVFYLPVFHPNVTPGNPEGGKSPFALYHGNLGVAENNEAALFLINKVFAQSQYPLVIAGMNPSATLRQAAARYPNVKIEDKLDTAGINRLIGSAQINILPTFQNTGIKLKLINVMFNGGHCIVNPAMVQGTGLESLCHIAAGPEEFCSLINDLKNKPFGHSDFLAREAHLSHNFSNAQSVLYLAEHAGLMPEKLSVRL